MAIIRDLSGLVLDPVTKRDFKASNPLQLYIGLDSGAGQVEYTIRISIDCMRKKGARVIGRFQRLDRIPEDFGGY